MTRSASLFSVGLIIGIGAIHYGIILIANRCIGLCTPARRNLFVSWVQRGTLEDRPRFSRHGSILYSNGRCTHSYYLATAAFDVAA